MSCIWMILLAVRLLWTVAPQTGYIHPDEFFQTAEPVAGDVLNVSVLRTWEFDTSHPLRSMVLPNLIYKPVFKLLQYIDQQSPGSALSLSPYKLLVGPRLVMVLFSLLLDLGVYRISRLLHLNAQLGLILTASSYVTLTYQCHTFTNSLESLLFMILLVTVYSSVNSSCKVSSNLPPPLPSVMSSTIIAVTCVLGIFNRPTFAAFAVGPCLWWFYCSYHSRPSLSTLASSSKLAVAASITTLACCVTDTIYYRGLDIFKVFSSTALLRTNFSVLSSMVFTPFNFVEYNFKSDNLSEHGLHPHYLHMLVNLPLLYGPLMFYFIKSVPLVFYFIKSGLATVVKSSGRERSQTRSVLVPLFCFALFPVLILSVFPHQEPRFLIPVLPLMVLIALVHLSTAKGACLFLPIWASFNVCLALMYGAFHQGGLIPSVLYLEENLRSNYQAVHVSGVDETVVYNKHVVFYHTYMPPRYLFSNTSFQITDVSGGSIHLLQHSIQLAEEKGCARLARDTYLITPLKILGDIEKGVPGRKFKLLYQFFPHLSMEDPPDWKYIKVSSATDFFTSLIDQMSLCLIKIE